MRLSAAKLFHSVLGSRPETADAMFRHGGADLSQRARQASCDSSSHSTPLVRIPP